MDEILKDLKAIRENVENSLNEVLTRAEAIHSECNSLLSSNDSIASGSIVMLQKQHELLQAVITVLRQTVSLNNARCAELARQLTVLPAKRVDLMIESIEKRLETLEADFQRSQRPASDHE